MYLNQEEVIICIQDRGTDKVTKSIKRTMILAFLGGLFTSFGYLGYLRAVSLFSDTSAVGHLIGSMIFPIGVIMTVITGAELFTGNSLDISLALFSKRIRIKQLIINLTVVGLFNFIGSVFSAYLFGHILGLTEGGYATETIRVANLKVDASVLESFISGIGCNILVCMAIWMSTVSKSIVDKVLAIWFPIMLFVLLGLQNSVANMFVVSSAVLLKQLSWLDFLSNIGLVMLGNLVGAMLVATFMYQLVKKKK